MARPLKNRLDKQYEMASHWRAVQMHLQFFLKSHPGIHEINVGNHTIARKKLEHYSRGEKRPSHALLSELSGFFGSSAPPAI